MLVKSIEQKDRVKLYAAMAITGITACIERAVVVGKKVVVRTVSGKTVEFYQITDRVWQASVNQKQHYGISAACVEQDLEYFVAH